MRHFLVYQHPEFGEEAVKIGFSWPALFFGIIWMMVKKLWMWAGIWFVIALVFNAVAALLSDAESGRSIIVTVVLLAVWLWLWLYPAIKSNEWRHMNLENKGYNFLSDVEAESPDAAIAEAMEAEKQAEAPRRHAQARR